jgi:hypothetical protein
VKRVALLAVVATLAACDDTNVHLLYGQQYDTQYACMLPDQSIDIINGPDPGQSCSPVCITATVEGGTYAYISTTCPPYDPYPSETKTQTHGPSDRCTAAFKAYDDNIECGPDGGPPEGGVDAGADADAGFDATLDAPSDGTTEAAPESGAETGSDGGTDAGAAETGAEAAVDSALE